MVAASLFAGIGGFDLGLQRAGVRTAWQVEQSPASQRVLRRHFPDAELHDDVRTFADGSTATIRADLVCGGFPCQDLSVAGRRAGLAGERSGLFFEFMRIVDRVAPRWVLIENVPGLLSSDDGRDMLTVLGTLAELGYGAAYRVLDAQWLGVAQQRERVFIVGCAGTDWRRAAAVLFEPEGLPWDSPPSREAWQETARCLTAGSGGGGHFPDADTETLIPTCVTGNRTHAITAEGCDASEDGTGRGTPIVAIPFDPTQVTSKHNRSNPQPGSPCHPLPAAGHPPAVAYRTTGNDGCYEEGSRVGSLNCGTDRNQHVIAYQCHGSNVGPMGTLRAGNGNESAGVPFVVTERGRPEGRTLEYHQHNLANALMAANGGRSGLGVGAVCNAGAVRRLTPRECERLQGFPDDWTAGESDTARYRMLGNAVAVPVAEWIARRMVSLN